MLKKRVIACLNILNNIVVQSIDFKKYLPVGKPEIAVEFLNDWGIDEIILIDIEATRRGKKPNLEMINKVSSFNMVPLTVGGGIKTIQDIENLMHCGADKVCINSLIHSNLSKVKEATSIFGCQSVVASVDIKKEFGKTRIFNYLNKNTLDIDYITWIKKIESFGVGEIFVNSVDNDGKKQGYDFDLFRKIANNINIPLLGCGGAGSPDHMLQLLTNTDVSAAVAGNFFHFYEHSVNITKSLISKNIPMRDDSYFQYKDLLFDKNGRLLKKSDDDLEKLLFIKHIKEDI